MLHIHFVILLLFGSYSSSYMYEGAINLSNDGPVHFENRHNSLENKNKESATTLEPSSGPTIVPSHNSDSPFISYYPSSLPTGLPSLKVIFATPTFFPTRPKSNSPSRLPSKSPTSKPSFVPSKVPTKIPSRSPSLMSSPASTDSPSIMSYTSPSLGPTSSPTATLSSSFTTTLTTSPTLSPSASPTTSPITSPTTSPTLSLTASPTANPTSSPTTTPTTTTTNTTSFPTLLSSTYSPSSTIINYPTGTPTTVSQYYLNPTITTTSATSSPTIIITTKSPTPSPSYLKGSHNSTQINSNNNNNISNKSSSMTYLNFTSVMSIILFVLIICVACFLLFLFYRYHHICLRCICGESISSKLRSSRQQGSKTSGTTDTNTSNTDPIFEPENVDFVFDRQRVLQSTRNTMIPSSPARTIISQSSADSPSSASFHPTTTTATATTTLTPSEIRTRRLSETFRRNGMELSPLRMTAVKGGRGGGNTSPARVAAAASKRRSLQFPQFVGGVLNEDYRPFPPPLPEISSLPSNGPLPPPPPLPPRDHYHPNTTVTTVDLPIFPSFDPSDCLTVLPKVMNDSHLTQEKEQIFPKITGGVSQSMGGGVSNNIVTTTTTTTSNPNNIDLPSFGNSNAHYAPSRSLLLSPPTSTAPPPPSPPLILSKSVGTAPHPPPPPRPPPPPPYTTNTSVRRLSEQTLIEIAQARSRLSSRSHCNNIGDNSCLSSVNGNNGSNNCNGHSIDYNSRPIPLPIPHHLLPVVPPPLHELPDRLPLPDLSPTTTLPSHPYSAIISSPSSPSRPSSIMRSPITRTFTSPRRIQQQRVSAEGDSSISPRRIQQRVSAEGGDSLVTNNQLSVNHHISRRFSNNDVVTDTSNC